jgi:hypothetical protein
MFPLPTFTLIFILLHICMNLKSMIQPSESSTPSLMFHEKPVRHVLVRVHSKCHTCVKYLFVLQIHFLGVQADYKHHMPLRHNKN